MTIEQAVFRFAGIMVLLSVALTYFLHPNFIWLTAFIGVNLTQYSFTGLCPAATVFKAFGLKPACESNN
ncbi:YgaP family membrane protein [Thalassotalea sp. PLHSN55]|uniref:YgaP family membrane protein n=1 Tax=Thalassotalea sp. PLHSN55 TaxID=3435888 RepID=UPI003F87ED8E